MARSGHAATRDLAYAGDSDGDEQASRGVLRTRERAGHYHSGVDENPTRVGTVEPTSGTMTDGIWPSTWLVPEFAQEITFRNLVRYKPREAPDETRTDWFYGTSPNVSRFTGLARIPPNETHYDRVGGTSTHPEHLNDWAVPELVEKLQEAARLYHLATGDRSRINDMSLQYGGRFDIRAAWGGPHAEHRFADADLRPYNWSEGGGWHSESRSSGRASHERRSISKTTTSTFAQTLLPTPAAEENP